MYSEKSSEYNLKIASNYLTNIGSDIPHVIYEASMRHALLLQYVLYVWFTHSLWDYERH